MLHHYSSRYIEVLVQTKARPYLGGLGARSGQSKAADYKSRASLEITCLDDVPRHCISFQLCENDQHPVVVINS